MTDRDRRPFLFYARAARALLLVLGSATAVPSRAAEGPVAILSGPQASYHEAVAGLKPVLQAAGYPGLVVELPKADSGQAPGDRVAELVRTKPRLVVTVGAPATALAIKALPDIPIIFCMVPNALDQPFMADNGSDRTRLAGVTTDCSPQEQVHWVLTLVPSLRKIGVLYSPRTQKTVAALQAAAGRRDLSVVAVKTDKDSFTEAIKVLNAGDCGGAIMLPDAAVYDPVHVRALLLWGIHQKKPVWTFSDNIVRAGAFFGLYAEPTQVGRQAGELAVQVLRGKKPAALGLQYAGPAASAVNEHTAELIGIDLAEDLLKKITKRYGKDQ